MPSELSPTWHLKKHGGGETHGPVAFSQIRDWAGAAHINPHDLVSNDGKTWNKAPMVPELGMDWLVEVPDSPLYGPTTPGAILEFLRMGEIATSTRVINCCTGESMEISRAPFFEAAAGASTGGLQKRIEALEAELAAKSAELEIANTTIDSLRRVVGKLESRLQP